jgi:hypothetical protein
MFFLQRRELATSSFLLFVHSSAAGNEATMALKDLGRGLQTRVGHPETKLTVSGNADQLKKRQSLIIVYLRLL